MFPSTFEYHAASSIEDALRLLEQHGDDAKLLAGGHSLLPLMKLRLAAPAVLIDLGSIPQLATIDQSDGETSIGATATYAEVLNSEPVARFCPLLAETVWHVGDVQVRNRGTLGGALAHGDPAGDIPAAVLALDAMLTLRGPTGTREVPARDFFLGPFTTALDPNEVLTAIRVRPSPPGTGTAYEKVRHPASGYAVVGVAAVVSLNGGQVDDARVGITGVGSGPVRAFAVEEALRGRSPDEGNLQAAAKQATDGLDVLTDPFASSEYRVRLARISTRRALARAAERAAA